MIIAGGSGFLGRTLAKWFAEKGDEVVILSRSLCEIEGARTVLWDGRTQDAWSRELEGAFAVINLAGRTVNCRYTEANRKQMIDSRVESTRVLGEAIASSENPPAVWLNSSTATIYRHRYDEGNTEQNGLYGAEKEAKDVYSLEVAHAWEDAFVAAYAENELSNTRGVVMRTAMVFGVEPGGVFETLGKLTKLGLGGTMGHGRQFVSWLHEEDFCEIIGWLLLNEEAQGVYNLTAPEPLANREMMRVLRKVYGVAFGLPAFKWMLEIGAFLLRTETELIVKSRRVEPERLLTEGYEFRFRRFEKAVQELRKRVEGEL